MIRYWLLLPVLAALGLVGSAWWWDAEKDWWHAPPAKVPDIQTVDLVPMISTVTPLAALERPVFWSSRRVKKPEPVKDTRQADELSQARLLSVVQSGKQLVALLRRKDGSLAKYSHESQPWRVESFDGRTATFVTSDGQKVGLPLEATIKTR